MRRAIRNTRLMRPTASLAARSDRLLATGAACDASQQTDRLEQRQTRARAFHCRVHQTHSPCRFQPQLGNRRLQLDAVAPLAFLDESDHRVEHLIRALRA